jgi:hypothetical protein
MCPAIMHLATLLLTACGAFLLAVVWIDLIFDTQVLAYRSGGDELPEPVLASIAGYYHRATTTSRPMSYLISLVMVVMLTAWLFGLFERTTLRGCSLSPACCQEFRFC